MSGNSLSQQTAQLDNEEREHLEAVVEELRERVEDNVEFRLTQKELDDEPADLDALDDLKTAFEIYAKNGSEPVEAHLYDLFEYYASNGILFMTYYFDTFEDAGQTQISDSGVSEHQRLLSELASDLDEYKNLANEIVDACNEIAADISSEWSDRALSEITTAGYQPNRKHGVKINITPLADAEIVPKTVDNKVL